LAIKHGHKDLVRYLLSLPKIEKLLNMEDFNGRTPEYYARLAGNEDILDEFFTSKLCLIFSNMFICQK
jgi:ankyrin repeat protein